MSDDLPHFMFMALDLGRQCFRFSERFVRGEGTRCRSVSGSVTARGLLRLTRSPYVLLGVDVCLLWFSEA